MPTLQLKITPPQPAERLQVLARRLTDLTADVLGKRREVTAVVIEELWPGRWFIGGRPAVQATALLEIRVTEGTNSPEEKQTFVQAAYEELWQQLGPLAEASYVVVQEVAATDWGYGGRTQAERKSRTPVL
jgi:4-oxalocrotonate tautomerase